MNFILHRIGPTVVLNVASKYLMTATEVNTMMRFFFNDTAPTEIYTLSLHDALPISSQSRTSGTSETIQKRALITPDEIGQVFARVDDRERVAYPGLALTVISGARPVVLRRVNYYEDYQFMGLFDPHPDHAFAPSLELCVEGRQLGFSLADFGLQMGGWSLKP